MNISRTPDAIELPDGSDTSVQAVQRISSVPTILDVICRLTGMGFAAVARVTEDRWLACQVQDNVQFGLVPGGELPIDTTLCNEVRQCQRVIAIDDVSADETYRDHHTPRIYGLRSYISVPIMMSDGRFFGTLCAIDAKPARLNSPEVLGAFQLFAELIAQQLEADERLKEASDELAHERAMSELREIFIAVLGHDLRNPIASMDAGISRLLKEGWTERSPRVLQLMKASVARASGLIDNVMDFARARMGGGITLERSADESLEATLTQVVDELRSAHPDRSIETVFRFDRTIAVDHQRIAQMFSNLLGNALTHGEADTPIRVYGDTSADRFELAVSNGGQPIGAETMERLFQPFRRADPASCSEGLGLGLYIASQIAEAHGGRIDVSSADEETRFTFRMPLSD